MTGLVLALASFGCDDKAAPEATPTSDLPAKIVPESAASPAATSDDSQDETAKEPTGDTDDKRGDKAEDKAGDEVADKNSHKAQDDKPAAPGQTPKAKTEAEEPDKPDEVKKGEGAAAASFSTWLQSSGSYEAGKQGTVTAVLVAKAPYKCNDKYPYKFKVDPPSGGVTYPQSTVRAMQVSPKRSTMSIPFVPAQAGKATVSGELSFSICTDERCIIEKKKLSVTVDVE